MTLKLNSMLTSTDDICIRCQSRRRHSVVSHIFIVTGGQIWPAFAYSSNFPL